MTDWTTGTCKTNGISVHYVRTGGDKPPVVLLHGLIANGVCWTPLARALEADYDLVMPDARGHGRSDAPAQAYRYDDLAADVMGFIDALKLDRPVLIGHSMGGMTAALVANRHPQRLRGLVLVDPTFLTPQRQREVYESDVADQHRQILNRSKEDCLADLLNRHRHRSREIIELLAKARFQTSAHAFDILTPPNPDYRQLIQTLEVPGLLVIGDAGSVVSPDMATELAALNQRLEIVQIAQAGHGIPYDQPARLSAIVQAFVTQIPRACSNIASSACTESVLYELPRQ